ncbi:MAG: hypothetical protein ACYC48_02460 [Minisyncoccota bacterium]
MNPPVQQMMVNLPVAFIKEGEQVVAYTPALDLSTSGKDEAEAKARFGEIVGIFFKDLLEQGTLGAVLSDLGWQQVNSAWNPPVISQESMSVAIPAYA